MTHVVGHQCVHLVDCLRINRRWSDVVAGGYVYILTNDRLNVLYVGCTNDLRARLVHHKQRLIPGFTKRYNVHRLVYFERFADIDAARRRERLLKGMSRAKKDAIVTTVNPERRDVFGALRTLLMEL